MFSFTPKAFQFDGCISFLIHGWQWKTIRTTNKLLIMRDQHFDSAFVCVGVI